MSEFSKDGVFPPQGCRAQDAAQQVTELGQFSGQAIAEALGIYQQRQQAGQGRRAADCGAAAGDADPAGIYSCAVIIDSSQLQPAETCSAIAGAGGPSNFYACMATPGDYGQGAVYACLATPGDYGQGAVYACLAKPEDSEGSELYYCAARIEPGEHEMPGGVDLCAARIETSEGSPSGDVIMCAARIPAGTQTNETQTF